MSRLRELIKRNRTTLCSIGAIAIIVILIFLLLYVMAIAINNSDPEYDRAIIYLPDGEVIEGEVDDYFCGEYTVKVTIDGKTYSVHRENVILIDED